MNRILIVASTPGAERFADALRVDLDLDVRLAFDRNAALDTLRREPLSLLLLDETMAGPDSRSAELFYKFAGAATVLELNFALVSVPRLVRQVRAALARRAHDQATARASAARDLESELGGRLTGLLLESQLVLRQAPPAMAPRLRHLVMLAGDLQNRLRTDH